MNRKMKCVIWVICVGLVSGLIYELFVSQEAVAQERQNLFKALGAPAERRVEVAWNRFYDSEGLAEILKRLHNAFPSLTRLYSIGESYQGRPIWCLEVTHIKTGDPARKPGMYIDGNIHGNEVQAGEVVAYTAWYLCEMYGKNETVTRLVDQFVFYLIPTINPDGRDFWLRKANTAHSSRSGQVPLDNDRDGLVDEDDYEDLDGDGSITQMRIRDPNGRMKPHPKYPEYLMIPAEEDERGEYTILGWEGLDNDGDGRVNEDGPGGYDPNRNWGFDWQPPYVQWGARDYPFSLPETRAVAQFVIDHPNIAGMQSYHNNGGMILRGPQREGGDMQPRDDHVLSAIAAKGELMLPFYRSMVIWRDLYTLWGGEVDWFYGARGILAFTNELWTSQNLYRSGRTDDEAEVEFIKTLLMNEGLTAWKEYDHPTYGKIEIGGFHKEWGRVPPSFLLEEECHRNMAFTLYHASVMPQAAFGEIRVEPAGEDLFKVWVEVRNDGMIPTRIEQDVKNHINPPDVVSMPEERVISSGRVADRYFKRVEPVRVRPYRVELPSIPGLSSEWIQFIVRGKEPVVVTCHSTKGGHIQHEINLSAR
ncbi:MAG TPA: M14 family metallopeptidase [bacterium]|nr:peptidase M14 [Candidatus Omnitrophota bacterium]HOJ60775.1 M14 family metallopeptidase [bacterium]HOL96109.1 M14 family metallopeptidase [bacterium]HPP02633.1 M14 family metallopeptidase [bacterium]